MDEKGEFLSAMRKTWQADVSDNIETIRRLKQKHTMLGEDKDRLIRAMASTPELASDFKSSITAIKSEIEEVEVEIAKAENIEEDFDYVGNLKDNWFEAEDPEEHIRLKELLYLDGLSISWDGKVRPPTLSPDL